MMLQLAQSGLNITCDRSPLALGNHVRSNRKTASAPRQERQFSIRNKRISSQQQQSERGEQFGRRKLGYPILRAVVSDKRVTAPTASPAAVAPEKPVELNLEAIVTVRRKRREDMTESFQRHRDSLADAIGQNVVLQLVSEKIDPSYQIKKSNSPIVHMIVNYTARASEVDTIHGLGSYCS